MKSRIYFGDSREVLPQLMEEFRGRIALVVTSPPYFIGRGYEDYIEDWNSYWKMLEKVFSLAGQLVEPYGKIAINFADKYANSAEFNRPLEICYAGHYYKMMHGHDLWARIIWDKVRVMIDGARHTTSKTRFTGQMRIAPNWEYIFVWRKRGIGLAPAKNVDMTKEEWREWVNGIWRFSSVTRNVTFAGTKLAIFPEELPKRLIKMYTEPEDVVLDPFAGTGTTIEIARRLGRVGIGVEKEFRMKLLLEQRLPPELFNENVEWIKT